MTDQIGRVLSGRYRLIAPIGTGASAQVYLADDVRLRRRVAVKVLHAALAEEFDLDSAEGEACLVAVGAANEWPTLVVAQRFEPCGFLSVGQLVEWKNQWWKSGSVISGLCMVAI